MKRKRLWNDNWQFAECPLEEKFYEMPLAEAFAPVDIPHDWMIWDTTDLYRNSIGWYRKNFHMDKEELTGRTALRFDGVYMDCTVYVNGKVAGEWKYGYSTFEFDITELVREGENEAAVRVVYQHCNSRWYSGAGIYRNVWLRQYPAEHMTADGVYVSTKPKENGDFTMEIDTEIHLSPEGSGKDRQLRQSLYAPDGKLAAQEVFIYGETSAVRKIGADGIEVGSKIRQVLNCATEAEGFVGESQQQQLSCAMDEEDFDGESGQVCNHNENSARTDSFLREFQQMRDSVENADEEAFVFSNIMRVPKPLLWDIGQGNLYLLRTELLWDGCVIDSTEERIGFKTMRFEANSGFFLNGRHVKLNGVCEHHDLGCLGAAFSRDAMARKLRLLQNMGVNAIRTTHNMPAPELMDLADEMGILILSEAFDMWEMCKTPYDYGRFFKEWCERDVRSWVRRDRNHASLLMWSIGNEIYDTMASEHGQEITQRLGTAVRRHDPRKNAPTTLGSNYMKWENGQKCADLVDVAGYNYGEYLYAEHHAGHPERIIYGSETSSVLASRGVYHFPLEKSILTDEDEQCSSLGNSITGWGAASYEDAIFDDRDAPYSLGQFLWCGVDYIGEPTPYNTKNTYFGQLDTAGFPKDSYYIFQAEWTDYRKNPIIHVWPYWDFNPGQVIDVQVCTNAPECELFLNGRSLGTRNIDHEKSRKTVQLWRIPYEPGKLLAVAYDENGNVIAEDVQESFGDTKKLSVTADRTAIRANGTDLLFLEIQALDGENRPVDNAKDRVHVTVSGAGRLVGLDNGDSADFEQHKGRSRRLFGGKLLAVIAAKTEPGEITVILESEASGRTVLHYTAQECAVPEGVSAIQENSERELLGGGSGKPVLTGGEKEIPIRRIELVCDGDGRLDKEHPSVVVRAKIFPENATYRDLEWKVLNETGIEIDYVDLKLDADGMLVTAKGDGEFCVRCSTRNGGSAVSVLSELRFKAEGIGEACLNPYKELPAGLADLYRGNAREGIGHGVSFTGTGTAGYSRVDFGPDGTEELTVSIFANTDDLVHFCLWENDPAEGGVPLLDAVYHVPHEWMVFQKMTYHLPTRLTGKKTLYFTTDDGFQLGSFVFTKIRKAFLTLTVSDCAAIYGDAFVRKGNAAEQIGNNVLIDFGELDFGEKGTDGITICGASPLEKSSIQLRFIRGGQTDVQMAEFPGTAEYQERFCPLSPVFGKCKTALIFLPGSNFNLASIRFHEKE